MTRMSAESDFADRPPWTKPGFIAAAALLGLAVIAGLVIAVWPTSSPGNTPPAPTTTAMPDGGGSTSTGPPTGPAPTPTAATDAPVAVPTLAPAGVTWQVFRGVALPVSPASGPARLGATATGYAHTAEGALIAAAHIAIRAGSPAGRASWEPTVAQQIVPGPDRDRLQASLVTVPDQPVEPGAAIQIAGFQYQSYTPDTAVIGLVLRAPKTGAYFIGQSTLLWRDGDWRMVAPPGGKWSASIRPAPDLSGVVEWGAR